MGEWISVKDRLPSEDGNYLVYCGLLSVDSFSVDMKDFVFRDGNITHWMPLPEPPTDKPGVLKTIYETPETCEHCYEHLSLEWSFCPECGHVTPWAHERNVEGAGISFESILGKHVLSGIDYVKECEEIYKGHKEALDSVLFTLDGITFKLTENPDDGYRSYCEELELAECSPKYTFQGIEVIVSMLDGDDKDCIVITDSKNGEIILIAGTDYTEDYYPICVFEYYPENMSCNQNKSNE